MRELRDSPPSAFQRDITALRARRAGVGYYDHTSEARNTQNRDGTYGKYGTFVETGAVLPPARPGTKYVKEHSTWHLVNSETA